MPGSWWDQGIPRPTPNTSCLAGEGRPTLNSTADSHARLLCEWQIQISALCTIHLEKQEEGTKAWPTLRHLSILIGHGTCLSFPASTAEVALLPVLEGVWTGRRGIQTSFCSWDLGGSARVFMMTIPSCFWKLFHESLTQVSWLDWVLDRERLLQLFFPRRKVWVQQHL